MTAQCLGYCSCCLILILEKKSAWEDSGRCKVSHNFFRTLGEKMAQWNTGLSLPTPPPSLPAPGVSQSMHQSSLQPASTNRCRPNVRSPLLIPPCKSANAPGKGVLLEQRVFMTVTILTGTDIGGDTPLLILKPGWQLGSCSRPVHQNPPHLPDSGGFLVNSDTYFLQMYNSNPHPCYRGDNLHMIVF